MKVDQQRVVGPQASTEADEVQFSLDELQLNVRTTDEVPPAASAIRGIQPAPLQRGSN